MCLEKEKSGELWSRAHRLFRRRLYLAYPHLGEAMRGSELSGL